MKLCRCVVFILTLILVCSCSTVKTIYVYPELPEYEVEYPVRPTLEKVESEVPVEVTLNTVRLITYAQELEITLQKFSEFYVALTNGWGNENVED